MVQGSAKLPLYRTALQSPRRRRLLTHRHISTLTSSLCTSHIPRCNAAQGVGTLSSSTPSTVFSQPSCSEGIGNQHNFKCQYRYGNWTGLRCAKTSHKNLGACVPYRYPSCPCHAMPCMSHEGPPPCKYLDLLQASSSPGAAHSV